MLKEVMKRAHELAKQMEGHYVARLALALRQAWTEIKNGLETIASRIKDAARKEDGVSLQANVWEKHGKRRIYFNEYATKLGYFEFDANGKFVKAWIERGGKAEVTLKWIKNCFELGIEI